MNRLADNNAIANTRTGNDDVADGMDFDEVGGSALTNGDAGGEDNLIAFVAEVGGKRGQNATLDEFIGFFGNGGEHRNHAPDEGQLMVSLFAGGYGNDRRGGTVTRNLTCGKAAGRGGHNGGKLALLRNDAGGAGNGAGNIHAHPGVAALYGAKEIRRLLHRFGDDAHLTHRFNRIFASRRFAGKHHSI